MSQAETAREDERTKGSVHCWRVSLLQVRARLPRTRLCFFQFAFWFVRTFMHSMSSCIRSASLPAWRYHRRRQGSAVDERGKAFYAQHDAESKDLERWVLKRDKTAYAQHDQRFRILQSATREETDRACTQCACSGLPQSLLLLCVHFTHARSPRTRRAS